MFDGLHADLRYAARLLRRSPGFSAVAVATLAIGIGANTAIFSVVDHVLLRPLAYRDPARLYAVHEVVPKFSHIAPLIPVNAMHFREWKRTARSFERMALIGGVTFNLTGAGEPERIPAARVSPALFPMLGVQTTLGRTFVEAEDQPGRDDVVVLDHDLWQQRFGGDRNVIGRKIVLDGRPYQVIGVLSADFRFPQLAQLYAMTVAEERPRLWKPFAVKADELEPMGDFNYACIVSLSPGVPLASAVGELDAAQARISSQFPERIELKASLVPLQEQITGRSRTGLQLLLAAVGVVLLIGCVNIANLLLARATGRRREMAIRSAVGASAGRLVQQMLVESLTLSAIGGVLGVAVAYGAVRVLATAAPVDLPRLDEIHVDSRVLAFTLAISVLAGLLFGLLPAWRFGTADPADAMKATARGTIGGPHSGRMRTLLVGVEVGLSAVCLAVGGLLLHSYVRLMSVDAGFDAQRVATVDLKLPPSRYTDLPKRAAVMRTLLARVGALPGVSSVGVSNQLPLSGEGKNNLVAPEGSAWPMMERPIADIRSANHDYFRTMGIPLLSGRIFDEADQENRIAVVSVLAAERLWPGQSPIGKRVRIGTDESPLTQVVGMVGDVRGASLSRVPTMTIYVPYWQHFRMDGSLAMRTAMPAASLAPAIRAAIHAVDPEVPVPAVQTMEDIVASSVAQRRFQTNLVLLFGVVAALLASLGIYGVIAYSVAQRTNELGIRMALGARPERIRGMVMRQGLAPVAVGLACGLAASAVVGRFVGSLLYGVSSVDPLTMAAVVAVIATVAAVAAYVPARRATRVDPVTALRYE